MTLRDRLIALADDVALVDLELKPGTIGHGDIKRIALAAARMALEDARAKCDYNKYVDAKSQGPWTDGIRDGMTQASLAIRALRDSLADI